LFITALQPLGLEFFNSINKLLIIYYFQSFSTSFYLLFFSYVFYNSKWSENFQASSQLALKNESKEAPPFFTFFHTNVILWSEAVHFFARPPKGFLSLQTLVSCNLHYGNFWKEFHIFSIKILQLHVYKNDIFLKNLVLVLKMAIFERFWW